MWPTLHHFMRALFGTRRRKTSPRSRVATFRPRLEALEHRTLLSASVVTTTADSGLGSLRDAVNQANASTGPTTIEFDLGPGPHTITLTSGELLISQNTTILGPGANQLAISGNNQSRVFEINSPALAAINVGTLQVPQNSSVTAAISGLTIEEGYASSSSDYGGGILNNGILALNDCAISNNSNFETAFGGSPGIENFDQLTVNNCTFSDNKGANGGGITNYYGTATVTNSTFYGNYASNAGGAIFEYSPNAPNPLTVTNCTIAGNSAGIYGGALFDYYGTPIVGNTILAGNTAPNGPEVSGAAIQSAGNNLSDTSTPGFGATDIVANPELASLGDYGGSTQTMALLPGSPAIDAGSNALIPIDPSTGLPYTTDQRGFARIFNSIVDIGAYEVQPASQSITFGALADQTYGDADFALTATASSGLPVSYSATGAATVYQDSNGNWFAHITGAGSATITATQAGNGDFSAATPVSQSFDIAKATLTTQLSSWVNPSTFGQQVTFTATVTNTSTSVAPAGAVEFYDGTTDLGPGRFVNSSGNEATWSFSIQTLSVGSHPITAVFKDNDSFASSTSPVLTQTVTGTSGNSSITANFNGTPIAAGKDIWFNSVLKVSGLGTSPVNIGVQNATISFTAGGQTYTLAVPNALITYSPTATSATTTYDASTNTWLTTVPSTGLSGSQFLDALLFPVTSNLPGGISNVTWQGTFMSSSPGVSVQWQWAAAVYPAAHFSTDYNALGVKPVDDNKNSQYQNSDHAGTPEAFKSYVIGGATGGGGSNYTGGYSGTAKVQLS